jgi:hypothetical protein
VRKSWALIIRKLFSENGSSDIRVDSFLPTFWKRGDGEILRTGARKIMKYAKKGKFNGHEYPSLHYDSELRPLSCTAKKHAVMARDLFRHVFTCYN